MIIVLGIVVVICVIAIIVHLVHKGEWEQVTCWDELRIAQTSCLTLFEQPVIEVNTRAKFDNVRSDNIHRYADVGIIDELFERRNEARNNARKTLATLEQLAKDAKYKVTRRKLDRLVSTFRKLDSEVIVVRVRYYTKYEKIVYITEKDWNAQFNYNRNGERKTVNRRHSSLIAPKLRFSILKRDNFTCQCCGAHGRGVVLDVISTRSSRGNIMDDLITVCSECSDAGGSDSLD